MNTKQNIQRRVHDGMTFFWTSEAILIGSHVIGFYFDSVGIPHNINRNSVYGSHLLQWDKDVSKKK